MKRMFIFTMMCLIGMFSLNAQTSGEETMSPVKWVTAAANETSVDVKWSMEFMELGFEDFESGSFITRDWVNDGEHPWFITEDAYQSSYAMRSSGEKVNDAVSSIEVEINVPRDGFLSFNHRISAEDNADYGNFYIDGVLQTTISGNREWRFVELPVKEGKHTYKWEYAKDGSRHTYDDAYFVDNITFFKDAEVKAGWIGYDDNKWATSIGTGSVSPVYWGISFPVTTQYAGLTLSKISVFDAAKGESAQYTAKIYFGGDTAPETLVSEQKFNLTGSDQWVEVELTTPVVVDGTQPLWITLYCDQSAYPMASSLRAEYPTADWLSLDGKEWQHAYEHDLNASWMLRGYLEDASGEVRALATRGFASKYNVYKKDLYKKTTELLVENTEATEYTDNTWETMEAGAYKWGVAAVYDELTTKTVYSENFEGEELPGGWTVYNENQTTPSDKPNASQNWKSVSNYSELAPKDGDYYVASISDSYCSDARLYLVSPQMKLPEDASMKFNYVNPKVEKYGDDVISRLYLYVSDSPTGPWTEVWSTRVGKSVSRWTEVEADLSEYANQEVYLAFCNKFSGYGSWTAVDDVRILGLSNESDIFWSNTVSKDMSTELTVTVETDSGDPVAGTVISLVNKVETEYTYSAILGVKDTYTFTDLRKGVYEVTISKKGFYSEYEGEIVEIWEPTELDCFLSEDTAPITDLYVSPTGWVTWEGENIGVGDEFYYDFEDGTLNGWTTIDADNDNYTWQNSIEIMAPGSGHDYSIACVTSMSWIFGVVLTPDNYLVTANKYKIDETSKLRFWVCAQDIVAPNDHYGVAVSLAGNTDPADFITIWEETLTAKTGTREQGQWYEKVVDLSDYAGQEIYIALRHFNCTDQFYVNIDDVSLESSAGKSRALESYQVYLDGKLVAENLTKPFYQHENLVDGQKYTTTVVPVYAMGDGKETSYTWRKIACDNLEGVTDLTAGYTNGVTTINWTLPENNAKNNNTRGGEWLTYDNGEFAESIGLAFDPNEALSFQWGVMFPADKMAKYAGQYLTKVSLYDCEAYEGMLYIYRGGSYSPQILLYEQEYQCTGAGEYINVDLDVALPLSGNDNIWVILENKEGGVKPAAGSVDCGDPNGRWIAYEGEWYDLANVSVGTFSWQIQAYVTDEAPVLPEAEILGVNIYRNGTILAQLVQGESFVDENATAGDQYELRVVYGGEKDVTYYAMSCPQSIVADLACPSPKDLKASAVAYSNGQYGTLLEYPYIPPTAEWLYYDLGTVSDFVGGVSSFYYGIKFPIEKLEYYAGTNLTKVMFYDLMYEGTNNDVEINIYFGGDYAPEILVHTQAYAGTNSNKFVEVELTAPIPVSGEETIWVVLKTNNGMNFPAPLSKDCGDPNARWFSEDGEKWMDITKFQLEGSFMIRAFVTNVGKGISTELGNTTRDLSLINYNIYRGTTLDEMELIASTTKKKYFDEVEKGTYYYQVTAVYEEDGQECESAPARAYGDYSQNYVKVEVTAIEENGVDGLKIYPNPTNGNLNIQAEAMRRITIANALGQVVYDQEVNSDSEVVDMAQYQTGVYMVRITTDNGVAVKRINVVK